MSRKVIFRSNATDNPMQQFAVVNEKAAYVPLQGYTTASKFGRRVPKEKFYEHGSVTTAVREKFVAEVQRISWAYKLAKATINLSGSAEVPEIQIFQIDAKRNDVAEPVLSAIDKVVKFPIIFEISCGEGEGRCIRMTAALKDLGSGTLKISRYYTTGWQPVHTKQQLLPTTITLQSLYKALLELLTPV